MRSGRQRVGRVVLLSFVQTRRATGGEPGARIMYLEQKRRPCPVWGPLTGTRSTRNVRASLRTGDVLGPEANQSFRGAARSTFRLSTANIRACMIQTTGE